MLIDLLQALLLGIAQGLTEFIPVSSSAHLVLVPALLGFPSRGLAFDVALHVGTFGAVLVFFRTELVVLARSLTGREDSHEARVYRRLALLIVLATVPVSVVGLALEPLIAESFERPVVAALFLLVTAAILLVGERARDRRVSRAPVTAGTLGKVGRATPGLPLGDDPADPTGRTLEQVTLREALLIGVGQCLALLPGVSRSGTTIVTGMAAGLTREAATRFSFLLSLPVLVGAAVLSAPDLIAAEAQQTVSFGEVVVGVLSAFISGYAAMRFLIRMVAHARLTVFARYCAVTGVLALLILAF
ncbi:MAG: undecaprenyl-diphosphate phosphatase [Egibacteraceae bacterium]